MSSALRRARSTLRARQPAGRLEWASAGPRSVDEHAVLEAYMDAWERADAAALTALLREDARWAMPPAALWFDGRPAITQLLERYPIDWRGRDVRMVPTAANRQPAAAAYLRYPGESAYRLASLNVLRILGGKIAEITTFAPGLCRAFDLPDSLEVDARRPATGPARRRIPPRSGSE